MTTAATPVQSYAMTLFISVFDGRGDKRIMNANMLRECSPNHLSP